MKNMRKDPERQQQAEPVSENRPADAEATRPQVEIAAHRAVEEVRQAVEEVRQAVEVAASSPRDRRAKAVAFQLAVGVLTAAFAALTFLVVHRARPSAELVHVADALKSYSFPSGHVMFYTGFFGFVFFLIFILLKPSWLRAFLLAILGSHILLIGLSRIYLGAHWASDTVGAYLLGGMCLSVSIRFYRWGKARSFLRPPAGIAMKEEIPGLVRIAGIHHPEALRHQDADGSEQEMAGCDQNMYRSSFQQQAGCGPCTATNLLDYAMQQCLPGVHALRMPDFVEMMHQVWHYVKPGFMGVHQARQLADGIDRYAASHNLPFHSVTIDYPARRSKRPSMEEVIRFLSDGLDGDSPVAFLNLSNGKLTELESWHWVTITAIFMNPGGDLQAEIANYGRLSRIDLGAWLRRTRLGGGFAYCRKTPASPD
jgi:hypothetical protein